jgi:hypothetical protein
LLTLFSISILQKERGTPVTRALNNESIDRQRRELLLMETIFRSIPIGRYRGSRHRFVGIRLQGEA